MRLKLIAALSLAVSAWSDVRLPALLSDGAVLQRDRPVRVWGTADPQEAVTVKFRDQQVQVKADALGRWTAWLRPMQAGGPDNLTVAGNNTVTVADVLVGEVWVASGQSNMVWQVERSRDAIKEASAANYPQIRFLTVPTKSANLPASDVPAKWVVCSPDTVPRFSGVGYFFARHLHGHLKVPIGMVVSAVGGTPAEAWTSLPALTSDPALLPALSTYARVVDTFAEEQAKFEAAQRVWKPAAAAAKAEGRQAPPAPAAPRGPGSTWEPAGLYNAMIAPLTPYTIRGAIWYQGESNASANRYAVYGRLFEAMIRDWRTAFGQGDFPFLFVQLANFKAPRAFWPELRQAQTDTLALRNTGMAVTIDIGNPDDIHPTNKQDVGLRLALAARAVAYGEKLTYSGPQARMATREGSAARLWFDHVGSGLQASGPELRSFEIAGDDGKFEAAQASIDGETVRVQGSTVASPAAVRYAWSDVPESSLRNKEGLPAVPFRIRLQ